LSLGVEFDLLFNPRNPTAGYLYYCHSNLKRIKASIAAFIV